MRVRAINRNNDPFARQMNGQNTQWAKHRADSAAQATAAAEGAAVSFSEQAMAQAAEKSKEMNRQMGEAAQKIKELRRQAEASQEQMEAMRKEAEIRLACLTIARRIMTGDKVPKADYQYLFKHDSDLYGKAVTLRVERRDPREYDRVSPEEEREGSEAASAGASGEIRLSGGAAGRSSESSEG